MKETNLGLLLIAVLTVAMIQYMVIVNISDELRKAQRRKSIQKIA